jgi:2-polyprenyl-3-methyl-5-hydroxy-6-metoxy-1,4-benzoquinol methylase
MFALSVQRFVIFSSFEMCNNPSIMSRVLNSYDELPYHSQVIPLTAPEQLRLLGRCYGHQQPEPEKQRVLEIGCGDGSNLIPMAYFRPKSEFWGIDLSEHHIKQAQTHAQELHLENIHWLVGNAEIMTPTAQLFDVIIIHGVYSWVSPEVQQQLLRLVQRVLSPHGIAMISYNTYPGWKLRGAIRENLLLETDDSDSLVQQAQHARELVTFWQESQPNYQHPYGSLLARELERISTADDSYVVHEYLNTHNQACWFQDFIKEIQKVELDYLTDVWAHLPAGWVPPSLEQRLASRYPDRFRREQVKDLLLYGQFRTSLLCHTEPTTPSLGTQIVNPEWISELTWASHLSCTADPFTLDPGWAETFRGAQGFELEVGDPLLKMVLLRLAACYPRGFSWSSLVAWVQPQLESYGYQGFLTPENIQKVTKIMWELAYQGQLDVRLEEPRLRVVSAARPKACSLTLAESKRGHLLTTAVHRSLPIESIQRELISHMHGELYREEILEITATSIVEESTSVPLEGIPPGGKERIKWGLEQELERTISLLSWWGLLEGELEIM